MFGKPLGVVLLSAWPGTSGTSPLAAILLLAPAAFIVPDGEAFLLPSFAVIGLVGFVGYRYISRASERAA